MDSNQDVSLSPTPTTPHPNNSTSTTIPIRAPLSSDSDFESAIKPTHSRTNSRSSSAFESEDGFLSGEDGFETADEKHDETLEPPTPMAPFVPPKAPVSVYDDDDDDDVVVPGEASEEEEEVPDHGVDDGDDSKTKGETVPEEEDEIVEPVKAKTFAEVVATAPEKEDVSTENPKSNGVLDSQGKHSHPLEQNAPLDSGPPELLGETVPADTKVVNDMLPASPKMDEVVNSEIGGGENKTPGAADADQMDGTEDNVSGEKTIEVVPSGIDQPTPINMAQIDSKLVEDKQVEPTNEGDLLLETKPKSFDPESEAVPDVQEVPTDEPKSTQVEVDNSVTVDEDAVQIDSEPARDDEKAENIPTGDNPISLKPEIGAVQGAEEVPSSVAKSLELQTGTGDVIPDQSSPADAIGTNSEILVEDRELKPVSDGDVLSEPNPKALPPAAGDVQSIEENLGNEVKVLEPETDNSGNVDAVARQSPTAIVEPDESKENSELSALEENLEPVENSVTEIPEFDRQESKVEVEEVQKEEVESKVMDGARSAPLHADTNSATPDLGSKPQTDSGTTLNGSSIRLAVNGDEKVSSEELSNIEEAQNVDSSTKSETASTFQEDEMHNVSTNNPDAGVVSSGDGLEEVVSNSSQGSKNVAPTSVFDTDVKEEAPTSVFDTDVKEEAPTSVFDTDVKEEAPISISDTDVKQEAEDGDNLSDYREEAEGSASDDDNGELNFGSSGTAEQIMKELMRGSGVSFRSGADSHGDDSQRIDGQIVMDSDEEGDSDEEEDGKELFDSAALTALLKAATSAGQDGGNVTITSSDGSRLFSVERPAGLGSSIRPSRPASQPSRPNIFSASELMVGGETEHQLSEEEKMKLEKLQLLRVKFLRLIHKLGLSPDDAIAGQVLYRMLLAAGRQTGQVFNIETAKKTAMQLEAEKSDDLDFSLNILLLGKTGVGKSATINSIFGEEKTKIGAFEPATTNVKEITGTVAGVKIRVFDTPGLKSSVMEQAYNRSILSSVRKLIKKFPVDILLYVDRLDTQTRDLNDLPMLRTITNTLGSSIWRSAIVTLTHAASAPPDGPSGSPLSYEVFVAQRSHIVQQSIGQAVGDMRMMNPSLMNPVSLVENHPSCRKNREGQRILPNGQIWRPQLLLLCYSLKVLSEVSSLSKPQDSFDHRKLFGFRVRAPPLPYLLSSLLQSRAHPKLPDDQGGENVDSDIDLEDLSDSDQEEEDDEYDQLPPFKPLRKAQIAKLSKDQRKAYFDEYDYRVKLLQKKQWKEELKRMKDMKSKGKDQTDNVDYNGEDAEQDGPAAVPVPLPDMVLPPSFDSDNPAYRYRFLEPTSQLLARPVLDTRGWDHDCGYDGVSLEQNLAIAGQFPGGVAVQITKDKTEFNIHLDSSVAAKLGEKGSCLAGFDIQTIGKQLGYIVRGETKFKNFKRNKTTGGVSVTFLGENVATGVKVEDQICIGKRLTLVGSTGTIRSQGDAAYGANLEVRLKEKDFPIGQDQSTLGLSLMRWRGDLALGANLQSQFSVGRSSKMSVRLGLNNKLSGQITVRTSSSEQLQLALVGILPIAVSIYRSIWPNSGESFSAY